MLHSPHKNELSLTEILELNDEHGTDNLDRLKFNLDSFANEAQTLSNVMMNKSSSHTHTRTQSSGGSSSNGSNNSRSGSDSGSHKLSRKSLRKTNMGTIEEEITVQRIRSNRASPVALLNTDNQIQCLEQLATTWKDGDHQNQPQQHNIVNENAFFNRSMFDDESQNNNNMSSPTSATASVTSNADAPSRAVSDSPSAASSQNSLWLTKKATTLVSKLDSIQHEFCKVSAENLVMRLLIEHSEDNNKTHIIKRKLEHESQAMASESTQLGKQLRQQRKMHNEILAHLTKEYDIYANNANALNAETSKQAVIRVNRELKREKMRIERMVRELAPAQAKKHILSITNSTAASSSSATASVSMASSQSSASTATKLKIDADTVAGEDSPARISNEMQREKDKQEIDCFRNDIKKLERNELRPLQRKLQQLRQLNEDLTWAQTDASELKQEALKYDKLFRDLQPKAEKHKKYNHLILNKLQHTLPQPTREAKLLLQDMRDAHIQVQNAIQRENEQRSNQKKAIEMEGEKTMSDLQSQLDAISERYELLKTEDTELRTILKKQIAYIEKMTNMMKTPMFAHAMNSVTSGMAAGGASDAGSIADGSESGSSNGTNKNGKNGKNGKAAEGTNNGHRFLRRQLHRINELYEDVENISYYAIGTSNIVQGVKDIQVHGGHSNFNCSSNVSDCSSDIIFDLDSMSHNITSKSRGNSNATTAVMPANSGSGSSGTTANGFSMLTSMSATESQDIQRGPHRPSPFELFMSGGMNMNLDRISERGSRSGSGNGSERGGSGSGSTSGHQSSNTDELLNMLDDMKDGMRMSATKEQDADGSVNAAARANANPTPPPPPDFAVSESRSHTMSVNRFGAGSGEYPTAATGTQRAPSASGSRRSRSSSTRRKNNAAASASSSSSLFRQKLALFDTPGSGI